MAKTGTTPIGLTIALALGAVLLLLFLFTSGEDDSSTQAPVEEAAETATPERGEVRETVARDEVIPTPVEPSPAPQEQSPAEMAEPRSDSVSSADKILLDEAAESLLRAQTFETPPERQAELDAPPNISETETEMARQAANPPPPSPEIQRLLDNPPTAPE